MAIITCQVCSRKSKHRQSTGRYCTKCTHKWPRPCRCGCGNEVVTVGCLYTAGHDPKFGAHLRRGASSYRRQCEKCGRKYDATHTTQKICTTCRKHKSCACGCGIKLHKHSVEYARGHHPNSHSVATANKQKATKASWSDYKRKKIGRKIALSYRRVNQSIVQTKPEAALDTALDGRIFKYAGLDKESKYGQPISADFVAPAVRMIVQMDGCYWHGCPKHGGVRRTTDKRAKDKRLTAYAKKQGWTVVRVWEHDVKSNLVAVIERIMAVYRTIR